MRVMRTVLLAAVLLGAGTLLGQTADSGNASAAIIELGGAPDWSLQNGGWNVGPAAAVEVTPIENWLEIEAGTTAIFNRNSTEWDTDLLFKKPWDLSKKVEFMAGIGPEWIHIRQNRVVSNGIAAEAAADFMFWPFAKRRFGWYWEPAYDYSFARGHEQSLGFSAGLLISIP
jgi:hypothetical protein